MKKLSLFFVLLFVNFITLAQNSITGNIVGKGKPYSNKISLRWNTDNYLLFKNLALDGVHIERLIVNEKQSNSWEKLTQTPIKAKSISEITNTDLAKDTAVAVVMQSLYQKPLLDPKQNFMNQVIDQDLDKQNKHAIVSVLSIQNPKAAFVAGLAFDDLIEPNPEMNYVYKITPAIPKNLIGQLYEAYVYISGKDLNFSATGSQLQAQSGDGRINISWSKDQSPFSGYFIERSTDNKNFKPVNSKIYLPESYSDSLNSNISYGFSDSVKNYVNYYYRIKALDVFGDTIHFKSTVSAMARDLTPPEIPFLELKKDKKNITLNWSKSSDKDLKGYLISRGKLSDANEEIISENLINPNINTYKFTLPEKVISKFYRVVALDTNGNYSYSNPILIFEPDTIPPLPPIGLKGQIDTSGNTTIYWNLDKSDEAILGYKIFMANQSDHHFTPISDIVQDTTFSYTIDLKSLTKNLYIKVSAIDASYNHSVLSEVLTLKKPDLIAPSAPQILDFSLLEKGITIQWSKNKSADHMYDILYKKSTHDSTWKEIHKTHNNTEYLDNNIVPNTLYTYKLHAIDSSQNLSEASSAISIRTSNILKKENINLKGTHNKTDESISLNWQITNPEIDFFILYKDINNEGLTLYKSLDANERKFSEKYDFSPKGKYALKIKYLNGSESELIICP